MEHNHVSTATKYILDGLSYAAITGVLMSLLPPIASVFTIVWLGICIWESKTVRALISRDQQHRVDDSAQK